MNFEPTDQDIVVNADELREFASQLYQKAGRARKRMPMLSHICRLKRICTGFIPTELVRSRATSGAFWAGESILPLILRLPVRDPHLHASTVIVVWDMWLASFQWS